MLIHLVVLFSAQTGQMTILMRGPRAPSRTFAGARPRNELPRRASNKPERQGRAPAPLAAKNLLAASDSFGRPGGNPRCKGVRITSACPLSHRLLLWDPGY